MTQKENNNVEPSRNKTPEAPKNIPERQVDEPKFNEEMDEATKAP